MNAPSTDRERLWSLIRSMRFCMLTSRDIDGHLRSRPMTVQDARPEADALWFFMSRRSEPVQDLLRDPAVNVAFADVDEDRYVSFSGRAEVTDDRERAHALWSKMAEAWFPGGPDDPDLAVVCVPLDQAEYWQVEASKPVQMFKMLRAAATGRPPTQMGDHGEVRAR